VAFDRDIRALVQAFTDWELERREAVRRGLSLDDQHALIQFARRSAVPALGEPASRCARAEMSAERSDAVVPAKRRGQG
jgi:hypothetical protein